jgi:hypothetical protein
MVLKAEILEAGKVTKKFPKGSVEVFQVVARDLDYPSKVYELIIYNKAQQKEAEKSLKKGMEALFKIPEVKGDGKGWNQYATPDSWKITKGLKEKIQELEKELNSRK